MNTKKKSKALGFLEKLSGESLSLGSLLEAIRLGEEMTQAAFAERLGVSKSYICDLEKGRKVASPMKARDYAKILGYSQSQFVRLAFQAQLNKMNMKYEVHLEEIKKAA